MATTGAPTGSATAYDPIEIPRWLLPLRDVISYIREHREMVIVAAVTLLVLLWGGSVVFAHSRR